ncbi:MAG: T9SS type A sorting domain-containing protein [Flavobacteriales bacterium]
MNYFLSVVLTFALAFSILEASGQTFDYFENDPEWRCSHRYNLSGEPPEFTSKKDYIYYFDGDSLVNDTFYLQLFERGEIVTSGVTENTFNSFNSLIRQEGKRIYQRLDETEYLLYDFDLEIGDMFPDVLHYSNSSFPEQTVQNVDSILINGNYHRTFSGNSDLIIEGIGHWQGVFNEPMINIPLDAFYQLHCYRQLGEVEYVTDNWLECNFNVSVEEQKSELMVSVYPNPTANVLFIELPTRLLSSLGANLQIIIRNSQGKQVFSEIVSNSNPTASVDLSSNASGIYLVSVVSQGKLLSSKRVILE